MTEKTVAVTIRGQVQGVGYRAWAREQARERGLSGHVLNRDDGTVEAVFHGPTWQVDAMVEACHQGPPPAEVAGVESRPADPVAKDGFEIRR